MKIRTAACTALLALTVALTMVPPAARAADPYEIDAILPQSGNGAFLGTAQMVALKLLEDLINKRGGVAGRPVKFNYLDDQSSAQAALIKDGPVLYCFSPGVHPPAGSYMFTAGTSTTDMIQASMRFFRAKGWTKLGIIATTDATGQDLDNNVAQMLALPENKNVTIVAHEHYNASDVSVAAQIARIKASGAQAMIAWTVGGPLATVFNAMQSTGLDIPVLATPGNMTYAQMKQYVNFLPKELGANATPAQIRDYIPAYHGVGVFGQYDTTRRRSAASASIA